MVEPGRIQPVAAVARGLVLPAAGDRHAGIAPGLQQRPEGIADALVVVEEDPAAGRETAVCRGRGQRRRRPPHLVEPFVASQPSRARVRLEPLQAQPPRGEERLATLVEQEHVALERGAARLRVVVDERVAPSRGLGGDVAVEAQRPEPHGEVQAGSVGRGGHRRREHLETSVEQRRVHAVGGRLGRFLGRQVQPGDRLAVPARYLLHRPEADPVIQASPAHFFVMRGRGDGLGAARLDLGQRDGRHRGDLVRLRRRPDRSRGVLHRRGRCARQAGAHPEEPE